MRFAFLVLSLGFFLQSSQAVACGRRALFCGIFRGPSVCQCCTPCNPCPQSPQPQVPTNPCIHCPPTVPNEIVPPKAAQLPAHIIVEGIPTGAQVFVDGHDLSKPGKAPDYRVFETPSLAPGKKYTTQLVVKYPSGTQLAVGERAITYAPGERVQVKLNAFKFQLVALEQKKAPIVMAAAAEAPATLEWDMPAEAEVYIDGTRVEGATENRITTPPLKPGKRYTFDVAVKYVEDGQTREIERNIEFGAGEKMLIGLTAEGPLKIAVARYPEAIALASR